MRDVVETPEKRTAASGRRDVEAVFRGRDLSLAVLGYLLAKPMQLKTFYCQNQCNLGQLAGEALRSIRRYPVTLFSQSVASLAGSHRRFNLAGSPVVNSYLLSSWRRLVEGLSLGVLVKRVPDPG